jgi:hypothetical protein
MNDGKSKVLFTTISYDQKNIEYDRNNLILVTFDEMGIPTNLEKLQDLA